MAHHQGGLAPAPARLGASGPRHALRPCRHIAVVHFADLPPLQQAMERAGDRPRGDAGGLAHLGRPEPLWPRGCEGRQDLRLTTGGRGGRRWAPWPRLGGRRRGLGLERWRGGRRPLGWRGGATGLAFFQPLQRRNPERFRAGKRRAIALLAQLRGKRVHRGNLFGEHADLDRQLHRAAYTSRRWGHRAILSSVINRMRASCEESTACTCMPRQVMACARRYSYGNRPLWGSAGVERVCVTIWLDSTAD